MSGVGPVVLVRDQVPSQDTDGRAAPVPKEGIGGGLVGGIVAVDAGGGLDGCGEVAVGAVSHRKGLQLHHSGGARRPTQVRCDAAVLVGKQSVTDGNKGRLDVIDSLLGQLDAGPDIVEPPRLVDGSQSRLRRCRRGQGLVRKRWYTQH